MASEALRDIVQNQGGNENDFENFTHDSAKMVIAAMLHVSRHSSADICFHDHHVV